MSEGMADEALAHLQTAAQEMIAAARAFLDVAEELVADPRTVDTVLGLIDSLAGAADRTRNGDDGEHEPVEHIRVS